VLIAHSSCKAQGLSKPTKKRVTTKAATENNATTTTKPNALRHAGLLGWPQCTFAASIDLSDVKNGVADRETDTGTEKISIKLPAVITTDLRLNEPRYATLPNIMKAKKKPIETIASESLGIDFKPRNIVLKVEDPPVRKAGIIVDNVDTLIDKLKNEAKVI
jgi:electron transfer flavoprotein beta subunit